MSPSQDPNTLDEIRSALDDSAQRVETFFRDLPLGDFYTHLPKQWAPVDDLRHLSRSSSPLVQALAMPKLALRGMFGRGRESVSYADMHQKYLDALEQGAVATGRYIPPERSPETETEAYREQTLTRWNSVNKELQKALGKWKDGQLDRYRLPHPVLGKLTVREMLFFTHFHNLTHIDIARKRVEQAKERAAS